MKTTNGSALLTGKPEIPARCKQHVSDLLNTLSTIVQDALDRIIELPENICLNVPPTIGEVAVAIGEMKNNKALVSDGIPAEIYKNGGDALTRPSALFV